MIAKHARIKTVSIITLQIVYATSLCYDDCQELVRELMRLMCLQVRTNPSRLNK